MDDGHNKRCGGCQNIFYCSSECQRLDRQRHKGECKRWKLEKEAARERELERERGSGMSCLVHMLHQQGFPPIALCNQVMQMNAKRRCIIDDHSVWKSVFYKPNGLNRAC